MRVGLPFIETFVVVGAEPARPPAAQDRPASDGLTPARKKGRGGLHHHTTDYKSVVISGTIVVTPEGGSPKRLGPGAYEHIVGRNRHTTQCDPASECTIFLEANGPWDVVMDTPAKSLDASGDAPEGGERFAGHGARVSDAGARKREFVRGSGRSPARR